MDTEEDEMEVTPEMIEAGTSILYDEHGVAPYGVDFDAAGLVERVYLAMVRLRRSKHE